MTKTYLIHAWCVRPFIACLDEVEADTPEQAIAIARNWPDQLIDSAEECSGEYPWDEFAAFDESGTELLHVQDAAIPLREVAPELLATLDYVRATLKLRHIDEATDEEVEEALAMADAAIARARAA